MIAKKKQNITCSNFIQNKEAAATFCESWDRFLWHACGVSSHIASCMKMWMAQCFNFFNSLIWEGVRPLWNIRGKISTAEDKISKVTITDEENIQKKGEGGVKWRGKWILTIFHIRQYCESQIQGYSTHTTPHPTTPPSVRNCKV